MGLMKENDNEVKGEGKEQDYGVRIYNPRIGKFLSVDPLTPKYPELTPYQFASNRPIDGIDLDGLEYFGAIGGQANQEYISNQFTPKIKTLSDAELAARMKQHAHVQIVVGRNVAPVIGIGLVNPSVGIPLALSYLTRVPVLPAPQVMGSVISRATTSAEVTAAESAASTAKPITVTDELYASLGEYEVLDSKGNIIGSVKNSYGKLDFYVNTKGTEYNGRGSDVLKALFNRVTSTETVTGINGTWSRGSLGSNLRAFNTAIKNRLALKSVTFESLSITEADELLKEAAFETFTGSNARDLGFNSVKINRVEGTAGDYTSASVTFTK